MKHILIILCLLFGFNSYAMQERITTQYSHYKTLSQKDSVSISKQKTKRKNKINNVFMIIKLVIYSIALFFLIALMVSKR